MSDRTLTSILEELERATRKFPTWPTDPLHAVAVLGEEFGELTKAVLQCTYEPYKSGPDDVRKEAIQTAAMALRFVASLDRYEYGRGPQHAQPARAAAPTLRPLDDWHEGLGDVLWWRFPVDEPPYVGSPLDLDWPGYHTHWEPISVPEVPA